MSSWRDIILNNFAPKASKLTLAGDPDSLLTEEGLALELRGRGFDLLEYSNPVEFRYAYESKFRSIWDRGEYANLVVILRTQDAGLESLPYDLLQTGRRFSFNLGDLFPTLSYPVTKMLDRSLLDALYNSRDMLPFERMGDSATMDFILRHVFGIDSKLIGNSVQLLRALLYLHYPKTQIPPILAGQLIRALRINSSFKAWPLDEIIPDSEAFFAFLQERWPVFLGGSGKAGGIEDNPPEPSLKYPGPELLPFDHQDIRIYIDNLFAEGKLHPVSSTKITVNADSWIRCGIVPASKDNDQARVQRLFELVKENLPTTESRYSGWINFALKWAELSSLIHCESNVAHKQKHEEVGNAINTVFAKWLNLYYASLFNMPPTNPTMLHHVARHIARDMEVSENGRAALIVVDGLSLDQWVTIRRLLQKQDSNLIMRESAIFAWIPTLTSVSRQAIFSGKEPIYFPLSIHSTSSEEKLWKRFWENYDLSRFDVAYQRGLGDGNALDLLDEIIQSDRTRIVGLVVDKVDKIMHGMQLGAAGMHNQIKQWCQGGFLTTLIGRLLDYGYKVWLTADHGNIECHGKGRPSEGGIAETRGERVRIYPTPELRSHVAQSFTFAHEWQPIGLPSKYFPLVASGHDAFVDYKDSIVGHGGISVEEVIVPFVKFEKST